MISSSPMSWLNLRNPISQGQYLVAQLIGITFADLLIPQRTLSPFESCCWTGSVILTWAFLGLATVQRLGSVGSPRGWGVLALGPAAIQLLLVRSVRARLHPSLEWAFPLSVLAVAALAACVLMVVLLLLRPNRANANGAG